MDGLIGKFFKYISLNVMGMIALSCYILADTFFVSRGLGATCLAALNIALPAYSVIHGIGLMIGIGGATQFAVLKASGNDRKAGTVFIHSFIPTAVLGIVFMLIGIFFSRQLGSAMGADAETVGYTGLYLKTILCFSPLFMLNNVVLAFVRNDGAPGLAMTGMVVGSLANIVLDYIFIFPAGMGMFGAALATGIAPVISLSIQATHFIRKRNGFGFIKCKTDPRLFGRLCVLGIPSLLTELSSGVVLLIFNLLIMSRTGNTGVAAYGVVANIAIVIISVFTGVAQGSQPLESDYYGAGEGSKSRRLLGYSLICAVAISLIVYVICYFLAEPIADIFNRDKDPELTRLAAEGIRLYFIGFAFAGFNVVSASYLSAVCQPGKAFSISICRGFAAIVGMAFLMSHLWGMTGIWLSFTAAEGISAVVTVILLIIAKKKLKPSLKPI